MLYLRRRTCTCVGGASAGENEKISLELKRRIQDRATGQVPIEVIERKPDDEDRRNGRRPKGKDLSPAPRQGKAT